jgi:hypothetical protein
VSVGADLTDTNQYSKLQQMYSKGNGKLLRNPLKRVAPQNLKKRGKVTLSIDRLHLLDR